MPSTSPAHSFCYVESDIPDGMTLSPWRTEKVLAETRGRRSGSSAGAVAEPSAPKGQASPPGSPSPLPE